MNLPRLTLGMAALVAMFAAAPAPVRAGALATPAQINKVFLDALQAEKTGRPREAVLGFRRILAANPRLVRVRLELARSLLLAGDLKAARHQFLIALSAPELPVPVRNNVLRFIRLIDAKKGVSYSFRLGITAPDEAGRDYRSDILYLDLLGTGTPLPFALTRPHVPRQAALVEASAQKLFPLGRVGRRGALAASLLGHVRIVDARGTAFDTDRADLTPGLRLTWPRTTLTLGAANSLLFAAGRSTEFRTGLDIGLNHRNLHGLSLSSDVTLSHVDDHTGAGGSGTLLQVDLGIQKSLRGDGSIGADLDWQSKRATAADQGYVDTRLSLLRQVAFRGGFDLTASAYLEYFRQGAATPGFLARRQAREYGIDLQLSRDDVVLFRRYQPYVSVGLVRHHSSMAAYSYDGIRFQLGLTNAY